MPCLPFVFAADHRSPGTIANSPDLSPFGLMLPLNVFVLALCLSLSVCTLEIAADHQECFES